MNNIYLVTKNNKEVTIKVLKTPPKKLKPNQETFTNKEQMLGRTRKYL